MTDQTICLWKFYIDTYYAYVGGLFLATKAEIDAAIGQYIYINDAMGKHGEFTNQLLPEHIEFVTSDEEIIGALQHVLPIGYDPLEHLEFYCPECGTNYPEDDFDRERGVCIFCSKKL